MAKTGLVPNTDEGPTENEIPDPPPEENNALPTSTTAPLTTAMRFVGEPTVDENEIPDPPPEENN
jgi:hypothetical protein